MSGLKSYIPQISHWYIFFNYIHLLFCLFSLSVSQLSLCLSIVQARLCQWKALERRKYCITSRLTHTLHQNIVYYIITWSLFELGWQSKTVGLHFNSTERISQNLKIILVWVFQDRIFIRSYCRCHRLNVSTEEKCRPPNRF